MRVVLSIVLVILLRLVLSQLTVLKSNATHQSQ